MFEPVINEYTYVGNFNPFPHDRISEVEEFFKNNTLEYIITKEIGTKKKGKENEHLHFYLKLKQNLSEGKKRQTFMRKITDRFPELKRIGKGGENKKHLSQITEITQFYYIFKDCSDDNLPIHSTHLQIDWKAHKHSYETLEKVSGSKFYKWLISKKIPSDTLGQKHQLIEKYIDWSIDTKRAIITSSDCEKNINYIIARTNKSYLIKEFMSKICRPEYEI